MYQLKPLSKDAVSRALEKAERYRLLNEPAEAQSICEDVLAADPGNQRAEVMLLLALTDQFDEGMGDRLAQAQAVVQRLSDPYGRAYYSGIVSERRAKALNRLGGMGSNPAIHAALMEAMRRYEEAEALRPPGNDDALLRWNACARMLDNNPALAPAAEDRQELPLE